MVKSLFRCWLFGCVLLFAGYGYGHAQQEQTYRGMLFPDLVVINFFTQLMNQDIEGVQSLFLDDAGVTLTQELKEYKGFSSIKNFLEFWLSQEKIDVFLQVDKVEVHPHFAVVGGMTTGDLLTLETGLPRHIHYQVESTLRRCGAESNNWCIFALTLTEKTWEQ